MQPNLALFFVVMALFCAAAVALQEYILAVAEGCATLLLLGCYQWLSVRRRRALADYVQATSEMLQHTSDGEMPFPVALVKLNDNELVWYNRAFAELTHVRERMSAQSLSEVIPGLSADFLAAGKQEAAAELRFEGRRYRVSGTVMPDADPKSGVMLGMLYLLDLTDLLLVRDEYIRSRPIVSIVLVDNYDELTNNMPDVSISALNAQLNSRSRASAPSPAQPASRPRCPSASARMVWISARTTILPPYPLKWRCPAAAIRPSSRTAMTSRSSAGARSRRSAARRSNPV